MSMAPRIADHLNKYGVTYDLVAHPMSATSLESARGAHVPADHLAKAVITHDSHQFCMCVIPASYRLVMGWLNTHMQGHYRMATEAEVGRLFDDCETGAIPALGQLYGMPVIWDEALLGMDDLFLESGDHRHLIHVNRQDFSKLISVQQHFKISRPQVTPSGRWIH